MRQNTSEYGPWDVVSACLLFLVTFGWFAAHAVPSLYFGDGGELLAAIRTGGIPHPTGFPLLLLLTSLPSDLGAFSVNLVSSAAGALAVLLTFFAAHRLFGRSSAWPAAVFLLGSNTLLLHSAMTRVYSYQLAALMAVVALVSAYRSQLRWCLGFGLLLGLSSGTHFLFLGGGIFACVALWDHRRELFSFSPWIVCGFILGASIYLWIPLRAHLQPAVNWGNPVGFQSLWDYLSQKQYAHKMFFRDLTGSRLFLESIARTFIAEWNPVIWVLALIGFWSTFRSHMRKALGLAAVVLFNVVLLFAYGKNEDLTILYRYFLPTYACAAILAAVATTRLFDKYAPRVSNTRIGKIAAVVILLLFVMVFPAHHWNDLSESTASRVYLRNLFRPLPRNATAILMGDNQVFPCAYGRYALGLREDLHLVEWEGTLFPEAFKLIHTPGSSFTASSLENTWYHQSGDCLFVAAQRQLGPPYHCRPWGFMYRLSDDNSERVLPAPPKPNWLPPSFTQSEKQDAEADEPRAEQYLMAAAWEADQGRMQQAFDDLEDAVKATPHTIRTLINAAGQYGDHNRDDRAGELLQQALELQPNRFETLLNLGIHYGKMGRYEDCRHYLLLADALQPNHPAVQHFLRQLDAMVR